jgi:effector-binding domain-containing protein
MTERETEGETHIEIVDVAPQATAGVRELVPLADLTAFFERAFPLVAAELERQGVAPAGPPFAHYRGKPGATVDVEAGFPVAAAVTSHDGVEPGSLPAGRVARGVHVGPYDTLELTYAEIEDAVLAAGGALGDEMWESYLDGPDTGTDAGAWRTLVTCPLA